MAYQENNLLYLASVCTHPAYLVIRTIWIKRKKNETLGKDPTGQYVS